MEYNPFSPDVQQNPYPYYAYLREHAPVYKVQPEGFPIEFSAIARYADVLSILRNPQVFSSAGQATALFGQSELWSREAPPMFEYDPPDHTRLRKLANRAFTPRRIASLASHTREVVHQLLDRMAAHGECDLVKGLSAPLPTIVIAELLGAEPERWDDFKHWSDDLVSGGAAILHTPEELKRIRQSMTEFRAYFQSAIEGYRKQPGDNLLSDLVRAEEDHQTLTPEEVLSLGILVLAGGNETTTNLIGNAVIALLENPDTLAAVRANLALIPKVVEETLRYDGSIQGLFRQATQEVELSGTRIPAGSLVMVLLGSANHDERQFPDPDRFDIMRNTDGHVGFGSGVHFCLGSMLARLEAGKALEGLLGRFAHFSCTQKHIPRIESGVFRGPKTLPLALV